MTAYSSLGMVKLSRTSLVFLVRTSLACNAGAAAGVTLAGVAAAGRLAGLAGAFAAALGLVATAFFTSGVAVVATVFVAVALAADGAGVVVGTGLGAGLEVVMARND